MKLTARITAAGYAKRTVLSDLDLEVRSGQMVALLGPNGAGKTTTMAAITGHLGQVKGDFLLDDVPIRPHNPRTSLKQGIAHVPEGRGIFGSMTVADNLLLRRTRRDTDQLQEQLLDRFPVLRERFRQKAGTLSGGEQQMLAIARALMARPRFLLVDEPSLGLAPVIVDSVLQLLREMCDQDGLGVLLAEQTQEVIAHSEMVYVLSNGRLVMKGSAEEMATQDLFGLYTGEPASNAAALRQRTNDNSMEGTTDD